MALTVLKVKYAKPGRHADAMGLCLVVKPSGSRTWVLRMQLNGQRRDYGLGPAYDVPLADARTAAAELHRRVRYGFDPVAEREKVRRIIPSLETATRACHETLGDGWKDGHHSRWLFVFARHVFPRIGKKLVDKVDNASVVMVSLRSVKKRSPRQTEKAGYFVAMPYADGLASIKWRAFSNTKGRLDEPAQEIYEGICGGGSSPVAEPRTPAASGCGYFGDWAVDSGALVT